jgi:hypothetical protein
LALNGVPIAVGADQEDPLVAIEIAEQKMRDEMMAEISHGRAGKIARALARRLELAR